MLPDIGGLVDVAKRCTGFAALLVALYWLYRVAAPHVKRTGLAITAIFVVVMAVAPSWVVLLGVAGVIAVTTGWLRWTKKGGAWLTR